MFSKFSSLLLILFNLLFLYQEIYSQEEIKASFRLEGDKIIIEFIVENGEPDMTYELKEVILRKEGDILFKYKPLYLEGAVGSGEYAAKQNEILWRYTEEEKQKLNDGSNYYFEIVVEQSGGGIPWYTYVGGAVIGGVVAILLGGKPDEPESTQSIPDPPTRPK